MKKLFLSTAILAATISTANAAMQPVSIDGNGNFTVPAIQAGAFSMPSFSATYTTETLQNGTLDTTNNVLTFANNAIQTTITATIGQNQQSIVLIHGLNASASNASASISTCTPAFNVFCAAINSSGLNLVNFGTPNQSMLTDFFNFQTISATGSHNFGQYEITYDAEMQLSPVPVPAAAWLFGSALAGLALRKQK